MGVVKSVRSCELVKQVVVGEMFLTLFLLLSLASHRGFQFSTTENEIPDDRSIVTINKLPKIPFMSSNHQDYIFQEAELEGEKHNSSKRASWDFYAMIKCATGCNPLVFKGYGCYCGFLGSGGVVDGIDRCCKMHDWCYTTTSCMFLQYNLPYFVPYKWRCNGGSPYCMAGSTKASGPGSCSHQLCECDREFVQCLADFPCPKKKAMCRSPWRYFQNLFMGLGTGMDMQEMEHNSIHGRPHRSKPPPLVHTPGPIFTGNRVNVELGYTSKCHKSATPPIYLF